MATDADADRGAPLQRLPSAAIDMDGRDLLGLADSAHHRPAQPRQLPRDRRRMGPEFDRSRRRRIDRLDDELAAGDGLLAEVEEGAFDAARSRMRGAGGQQRVKNESAAAEKKDFPI